MKIVFVDDEQLILSAIKRSLASKSDNWEMFFLSDSTKAFEEIKRIVPDLVVTDARMPIVDGIKLLKMMRDDEVTKDILTIMLTGFTEEETRKAALDMGVMEFVNKPIYPDELILRIRNMLRFKEMINALNKANKKLEEFSNTDALTGVYNRRYLFNFLNDTIYLYKRYKRKFLFFMFDIDGFKGVNDNYGHLAGDKLLVDIANVLQKGLRETDKVCRYGGDEFIVVMPETDKVEAEGLRKRILDEVRKMKVENMNVTISGGMMSYSGEDVEVLIKSADDLIYKVKTAGKNNILIG